MAYTVIELPDVVPEPGGTSWTNARFDSFAVVGRQDDPIILTLKVRNWNRIADCRVPYFEIEFSGVLEYRFIGQFAYYEDLELHERDYKLGLIEIVRFSLHRKHGFKS